MIPYFSILLIKIKRLNMTHILYDAKIFKKIFI
jgi:hypothetical protein